MERSRSQTESLGDHTWQYSSLSGTPQHGYTHYTGSPFSGSISAGTVSQTTDDVVTSNFIRRIERGDVICNPFCSRKITEVIPSPVSFSSLYRSTYYYWCAQGHANAKHYTHVNEYGTKPLPKPDYLVFDYGGSTRDAMESAIISAAATAAHANIDASEMLALASAAEGGKTVGSMLAIYGRLYRILKALRRFQLSKLAAELKPKELADRYMEYRYAIRPLIYDAYNLAAALQKNRGFVRKTYRGYYEDSATLSDTTGQMGFIFGMDTKFDRLCTLKMSGQAGVLCDVSFTDLTVFGVDQLFETAWELAPFSFIVDWFVSVGDWIAAHTPNAGVQKRASWVTLKTEMISTSSSTGKITNFGSYTPTTVVLEQSMANGVFRREELVLERFTGVGPSTMPTLDLKLDVFKLIDMGLILKQILKR